MNLAEAHELIAQAKESGAIELNLSDCEELRDLGPLAGLSSLQSLNLSNCDQVSDLGPLAELSSLQSLDLSWCNQVSDLGPLGGLSSLQSLSLIDCSQVSDLGPLAGLSFLQCLFCYYAGIRRLPNWILKHPSLSDFFVDTLEDVPKEVQSASWDNCLPRLRIWWADKESGEIKEPEVKLFLLGNGGAGKTQLGRMLQGLPYDDSIPTTHGIQLASLPPYAKPLGVTPRIKLWDFGGQDIYYDTHSLFLKGHAVFLILWTQEMESAGTYSENGLAMRHRPLAYWLDYARQSAGEESPVIIVQSQCDDRSAERRIPDALAAKLPGDRALSFSARTKLGTEALLGVVRDAVNELDKKHPPAPIGLGWITVRDELRRQLAEEQVRTIERSEFDKLCAAKGGVSNPSILLEYLHRAGVVFYQEKLFGGRIIVDQSWALEAIYTVFDRKRVLPRLLSESAFTRSELDHLVWGEIRRLKNQEPFTKEEQELFLSMMKTCGIFSPDYEKLRNLLFLARE